MKVLFLMRTQSRVLRLIPSSLLFIASPLAFAQPVLPTVVPSAGSGMSQYFTVSAPYGTSGTQAVTFVIGTSTATSNSCYISVDMMTRTAALLTDSGALPSSRTTIGGATSASNSQCTLDGTVSSFTSGSTQATIALMVSFTAGFQGQKSLFLSATDWNGISNPLTVVGSWYVGAPGSAPPVAVTLSPLSATLQPGRSFQFTPTVTGALNTAVNWTLQPAAGTITAGGLYTAPSAVAGKQTVTLTAASQADPTKTASATVTIAPTITITLAPSTVSLTQGEAQQFNAVVQGVTNTAVLWSVSPAVGSIAGGQYVAPATIPAAQSVTISAASAADPTVVATAQVNLVPPPPAPIASFSVEEKFGVSHPFQVIDFDFSGTFDPASTYMVGPGGVEVPYQLLSNGHVAVWTDLPAGSRRTWTLQGGKAPQAVAAVTLKTQPGYYEVSNGKTGVRILKPDATTDLRLAPIQGILLANGTWTANSSNLIYKGAQTKLDPLVALTATSRIVEQGPLQVTIEVSYTYNRPDLYYGAKLLIPGGTGYYKSNITLQVGQQSVLIDDDTNMDMQYFLNFFPAIQPNQARYRGHVATSAEFGHNADGSLYAVRGSAARPADSDAFRDLQYSVPTYSSYVTGKGTTSQTIRRIPAWDLWVNDSGWYWMLYNSTADATAPVVGAFAGAASKAFGTGTGFSGPGVYTLPPDANGQSAAGITFATNRAVPDGHIYQRVRMAWGLFVGTKGADLGDPSTVQNIHRQMNLYGGFNLNKIYRYPTTFADPPGGFGVLYMKPDALLKRITRVQTDTAYYQSLLQSAPDSRNLLDMWRDTTGVKAQQAAAEIITYANTLLNALVNGNGIYQLGIQYWSSGQQMSQRAAIINSLMVQNILSPADRERLKMISVLFASLLWDPDFVPLDKAAEGINLGSANMPTQQIGYRYQYALLLAGHPAMQQYLDTIKTDVNNVLTQSINTFGAHQASTNYIQAGMAPTLSVLQGLQVTDGLDLFASTDRLAKFGDFYINLLTPPEPRFGTQRKLVSIGDSTTTGSELYGVMATGFAPSNSPLSQRLMEAWIENGRLHSSNSGSTLVKIDDTLPASNIQLKSSTYPGWCSVLRNGAGTPNETAIWFVNGSFYSDHRHDDTGDVVMYALGNPLSLDWGSVYYPRSAGAYAHSIVVPESALKQPWDADNAPIDQSVAMPWIAANQNQFLAFDNSTLSSATLQTANGTTWTRTVLSMVPNSSYPVISVQDQFAGPDAAAGKVFTLNMAATGNVDTPFGSVSPILRSAALNQLPSTMPAMTMSPGVNAFRFTGQWGIDWNLYTLSNDSQQALIGNWAHTYVNSVEASQFQKLNGRSFSEPQHIFRLRSTGPFSVVLTPYRKGQARADQTLSSSGTQTVVSSASSNETTTIAANYSAFNGPTKTVVTAFTADQISAYGITISGGPTEVTIDSGRLSIIAHGAPGTRRITVPGTWPIVPPVTSVNGQLVVDYAGGAPLVIRF